MSEDKGFHPTQAVGDDTQPIMRTPKKLPPLEAAQAADEPAPAPPTPKPQTAPVPQALPPAPIVKTRAPGCLWVLAFGALVIAVASLLLNVALISALLDRQAAAQVMLDQAIASLDASSASTIKFDFPVSQTIDFEGDIPFQQDMDFPFKGNVRINTTIRVPVNLGLLGTQVVEVPVDTTVPVDTSVPVHIDQTFHVKTQVPVRMNVPIELSPTQPPFSEWLAKVRELLVLLRSQI